MPLLLRWWKTSSSSRTTIITIPRRSSLRAPPQGSTTDEELLHHAAVVGGARILRTTPASCSTIDGVFSLFWRGASLRRDFLAQPPTGGRHGRLATAEKKLLCYRCWRRRRSGTVALRSRRQRPHPCGSVNSYSDALLRPAGKCIDGQRSRRKKRITPNVSVLLQDTPGIPPL